MDPTSSDTTGARWTPFLVRLIVALIVLTPFVAIILQALGKR